MRIFTWLSFDLKSGGAIFHMEDYEGPVALAGGGGTEVRNETVPTGPFGPQIPFILSLFNEAANLYQQGPPQAFPGVDPVTGEVVEGGQLTPDINPNIQNTQDAIGGLAGGNIDQNQAIQQVLTQLAGGTNPGAAFGQGLTPGIEAGIAAQLGAAGNPLSLLNQGQTGNVADAYAQIFGQAPGVYDPGTTQGAAADASGAINQLLAGGGGQNPYLDSLVQGAIRSQTDAFNRNVLPGIRSEAQAAGQIGGTRQGIAEGVAGGDFINSIDDLTANIYGNAFNTQAQLQGQAVSDILGAQSANQAAGLQAAGINNQNYQQFIQSLLQGTGQIQQGLGQGVGLGLDAIGTGTAQAGNLFGQGNALQLQQQLQSLGLIPGFQAGSLAQLGAINQLGLQQYGLDQNAINALADQYYFNQNSPFNLLSQFQQFIAGPYGSTVGNFGGNPGFNLFGPNRNIPGNTPGPRGPRRQRASGFDPNQPTAIAPPPAAPIEANDPQNQQNQGGTI